MYDAITPTSLVHTCPLPQFFAKVGFKTLHALYFFNTLLTLHKNISRVGITLETVDVNISRVGMALETVDVDMS